MTRSFATVLVALATSISVPVFSQMHEPLPPEKVEVRARYLGVTGWEITDGKTHILIDPYLSRLPGPPADGGAGGPEWPGKLKQDDLAVPDTAAIDRYVDRADYILLTHAHYVHALDAPYIARTRRAIIIGSESVANIARDYGVPDDQIITVRGNEDLDFGTFSVRIFPSLHSFGTGKHYFNPGTAPAGAKWPLHFRDFVEGGVYGFLIRLDGVQIIAFGSMNYIEREVTGLHPDVALVAASPMRKEIYDYTGRLLRALNLPPPGCGHALGLFAASIRCCLQQTTQGSGRICDRSAYRVSPEQGHDSSPFRVDQVLTIRGRDLYDNAALRSLRNIGTLPTHPSKPHGSRFAIGAILNGQVEKSCLRGSDARSLCPGGIPVPWQPLRQAISFGAA